jgi:DNA-binding NarL/FixJ family response regulator
MGVPLRVVIADDHPFYREGLAGLLTKSGIDVVASVPNGAAAIAAVALHDPDVVLMDLDMPSMSGVEATRRIMVEAPATRVVVLSVSTQEGDVTDAILAGARGYVLKESAVEEIVDGLHAAVAGQSPISPRVASFLLTRVREQAPLPDGTDGAPLSAREREVLTLLAHGRSNQEIADELVISPSTVRNHISSILIKLRVDNRTQAAVRAVRSHLI